MEKEIRLILNELRKIENTAGSDKITRKKIDEICENHGVTFEELRDSVLRILTDETGISRDELESLSFEKISEKDLNMVSGGTPSTKRNIAAVMASLSCLTGVVTAAGNENVDAQSSAIQTISNVVSGSNQSQTTSNKVDKHSLLKKVGIPVALLPLLVVGCTINATSPDPETKKYYAAVYDRVKEGTYTDSALDIYRSIPDDERSETIIGLLPRCETSRPCPELFLIPPTKDKTTAYKYFISSWDKVNPIKGRPLHDAFLVYADGSIDTKKPIYAELANYSKPSARSLLGVFTLNFRNPQGGEKTVLVTEEKNAGPSTIKGLFYFHTGGTYVHPKNYGFTGIYCRLADDVLVFIDPDTLRSNYKGSLKIPTDELRKLFENELIRNQHYDMEYAFNANAVPDKSH